MSTALSPLLAPMLSSSAMRAVCDDATFLQNMLDFEAALARAEAATRESRPPRATLLRMRAEPKRSTAATA
jgi:adenylosuccinate lyase